MINLYINKSDDVVLCNDEFFTSTTYRQVMEDLGILSTISDLENVEFINGKIVSKFTGEKLHINCLSTGSKTLLNILKNPDKIFFIGECGDAVLEKIYGLESANIYASSIYLPLDTVENSIIVHFGNGEKRVFNDTESLYDWWCEYES